MGPVGPMRILHVVGARPNFIKAGPVHAAIAQRGIDQLLVHTGQHYDDAMSSIFFRELGLPSPDVNLEVGSGSHAEQTAQVMVGMEHPQQPMHYILVREPGHAFHSKKGCQHYRYLNYYCHLF